MRIGRGRFCALCGKDVGGALLSFIRSFLCGLREFFSAGGDGNGLMIQPM
jgi:hypothetical protein